MYTCNTCTCTHVLHVFCFAHFYLLGTRYLRRGVDEDGHVANYVETEMVGTILLEDTVYIPIEATFE